MKWNLGAERREHDHAGHGNPDENPLSPLFDCRHRITSGSIFLTRNVTVR